MSDVLALVRTDLRDFRGYRSSRCDPVDGDVWLNANESPWPSVADADASSRRYPEPQPRALVAALAELYGCASAQILVGRGSDEAIDVLVRAVCAPGRDAIVVTPPVFGMYAVAARLHGVRVCEVPLSDREGEFEIEFDRIVATTRGTGAKLVFLCSPGNPAGGVILAEHVIRLTRSLEGHALVVVDEAYIEFANAPSVAGYVATQSNLVVLRTLSKAHAIAGSRIGCAIANAALVTSLRYCQAPFPIGAPCEAIGLEALRRQALDETMRRICILRVERERVAGALASMTCVRHVYPSSSNFLLVRFRDVADAHARLLASGIVVRDMRGMPQLDDALRITLGKPDENDRLLGVLAQQSLAA